MSLYVFKTWFISVLIYPLVFLICLSGGLSQDLLDMGGYLLPFMIMNLVFAFPSLIMGLVAGYFLQGLSISGVFRFFLWLLSASVIVILNTGILEYLMEYEVMNLSRELWLPGFITVVLVSFARIQAFNNISTDESNSEQSPDNAS